MMQKLTLATLVVMTIILSSCERNDKTLSGQIILSSAFDFETASLYGYNFDLGKKVRYPTAGEVLPDMLIAEFRKVDGSILPGFASPSNNNGFALQATGYNSLSSARNDFDELMEPIETSVYAPESDTVRKYDIWVLKTASETYVKLLVLDVDVVEDPQSKHLEVTVDFVYQPDGTSSFNH